MIRKYGNKPFRTALLHGGPGAAGEMGPVADRLSELAGIARPNTGGIRDPTSTRDAVAEGPRDLSGILEPWQSARSVNGQVEELHEQLLSEADLPVVLVGYSWGAWLGFLFAARYPELVSKLILVSPGPFESEYAREVMQIRLGRLEGKERVKARWILSEMEAGRYDPVSFRRFGALMARADTFDGIADVEPPVDVNMDIYRPVWEEASRMREAGALAGHAEHIRCPVVAIHGEYDPHPAEGVERPLSDRIRDFRMIRLERCGHTPWKERHAREVFFEILRKEIVAGFAR